jgi:hypothetical protein
VWCAGLQDPDNSGGPGGYSVGQAKFIEPQCLDAAVPGMAVRHHACHGSHNQRWVVHKEDFVDGTFLIRSQDLQFEGKCLYAIEDGSMEMHPCDDVRDLLGARWYVPQLQHDIGVAEQ